jgi:hypothetical protein
VWLTVESVHAPRWTLQSCAAVCSDVLSCSYLFSARPLGAIVDGSLDLPRIGRSLHRHSRKAGPVPRPQFILLIEPDDGSRVIPCGIPAHGRVDGPDRRHHGQGTDPRHRCQCHRVRNSGARFANAEMRGGLPSCDGAVILMRTTLKDADIVVRQETRNGTVVYVIHTAPGPDQYLLRRREEAVAQAVIRAKRRRLDGRETPAVLAEGLACHVRTRVR